MRKNVEEILSHLTAAEVEEVTQTLIKRERAKAMSMAVQIADLLVAHLRVLDEQVLETHAADILRQLKERDND